ncbi:MAG: response regulator [Desulfobacterales bacterium]|nr:response regulator [Desulfobacterales bacterium]
MGHSEIKILVVDDEEVVNANLQAFLEDEGFTVYTAASGEAALQLLDRQAVDVGIIDMRLPGMDGNTLILNAHQKQPLMKFLIHTGSTNYALPQALLDIGLTKAQVFRKPLSDLSVLTPMINQLSNMEKRDD